ncbi:MAG: MFS transporter, partial [Pseudomonadota bacterium]
IVAMIPLTWRAKLGLGAAQDLAPSMHWPEPVLVEDAPGDGPVMVQVVYQVPAESRPAFLALIGDLAKSRRRGGGYAWACLADAADPGRMVESWREASWTDHQRHHQRVTRDDAALQDQIAALLVPGTEPEVTHLLTPATSNG